MENKLKHLEFIQSTISRLSNNSFLLKGWNITIISALFVLSSKETNSNFFWLAVSVSMIFWILDAYYLRLERKYRLLYNVVRQKEAAGIDFNLDVQHLKSTTTTLLNCLFSVTNIVFYLVGLLILSSVWYFIIK